MTQPKMNQKQFLESAVVLKLPGRIVILDLFGKYFTAEDKGDYYYTAQATGLDTLQEAVSLAMNFFGLKVK